MKGKILYIFLRNYNSYCKRIWLAAINKVIQSNIHYHFLRVWPLFVNLFASGAILKLLCSVNYYHPIQEDALTYLEYLDVQEISCLQNLS